MSFRGSARAWLASANQKRGGSAKAAGAVPWATRTDTLRAYLMAFQQYQSGGSGEKVGEQGGKNPIARAWRAGVGRLGVVLELTVIEADRAVGPELGRSVNAQDTQGHQVHYGRKRLRVGDGACAIHQRRLAAALDHVDQDRHPLIDGNRHSAGLFDRAGRTQARLTLNRGFRYQNARPSCETRHSF